MSGPSDEDPPSAAALLAQRQKMARELAAERERLSTTLASIGDAVISTDAEGRVSFLNRVAEALTGWPSAEALERPLEEVFRIVNETTRQPVPNPALRALREGHIVELANHTVLIARDGTERPIDDSAAPMRNADGELIGAVLVFRDVTERRRAEVASLQLAAIVQSSDDAIVSKTLDGIIRSWNAGAQRLFGYAPEEAIGRPITMLIPPDRQDEETKILSRLRKGERIEHFETVRMAKDGRLLDISLTVSPLKDHEGRIIGASKIARDITLRKKAERLLRESEARHRFLAELSAATQPLADPAEVMAVTARRLAEHLDVARCAYAEVEAQSVFVITGDHNRGVPSIKGRWRVRDFGEVCEQAMRANQPLVIDDVDTDARVQSDLPAYRATKIQSVICVPLHKDGVFVAAMAVHATAPRHWSDDEIALVRTVVDRCWETLDRSRAERERSQLAQQLTLALDAARLGDWTWDAATDGVVFSPVASGVFGLPPGEATTWTKLQTLLHPDDAPKAKAAVEAAVATRSAYDIEYRVNRPDGTQVWVSGRGLARYARDGTCVGMLGMVQDISRRKQLEHELRQRAEALAESDRKKDDFIALLAHELRNPLAPVRTGLQVMRLAQAGSEEMQRAREMMDRQLSHMVRLIDDLLDVSRMNRNKLHLQKTRLMLADVLEHALEATRPAIEAAGHRLEVSAPVEPLPLDGDLTRLAQVFGNLLSNSAKYTPRGGKIRLEVKREGDAAVVAVADDGIGIPREALPRVFDMFAQVDRLAERTGGGLGIGLALVKGLVEAHGGTVTAHSAGAGAGSVFTVRLPLLHKPQSARHTTPLEVASAQKRRVLIADDNDDAADSLADLLTLLGHEVHVARDGLEAVQRAETLRPELILMDVGMPKLDGFEATRRIRSEPWGEKITIVALTGWGQESDRERSKAAGCNGHLVKPIGVNELQRVLSQLPAG